MPKLNNFFALDISDNSLEVLGCHKNFWGQTVIKNVNRLPLEKGLIVDGQIKNANALIKTLKKLFATAKPTKITSKHCLLSIPENKVFTNIFKVPSSLKGDEVEDFLLNQAEGIIPFNRETVYADYVEMTTDNKEKKILYVAAPKKMIDDIIAILKQLNITVLFIELESLCTSRALIDKKTGKKATMIIDIGGNFSNIGIFDKGGVKLTVSLPVAGNHITKQIKAKTKLTMEKAEQLKVTKGLKSTNKQVLNAIHASLDKIINEATRSIEYYQQKTGQVVDQLLIIGGTSHLPGLKDYFTRRIGIEITMGNPWNVIKKAPSVSKYFRKEDAHLFTTVMGLIVRGLAKNYKQGINLLPNERQQKKGFTFGEGIKKSWWKILVLILVVCTFTGIIVFRDDLRMSGKDKVSNADQEIQYQVDFSVDYNDGAMTNMDIPRLQGELLINNGIAEVVLENISLVDFPSLAGDYLDLHNDTGQSITLRKGSRLEFNDQVYLLAEIVTLPAQTMKSAQVVAEDNSEVVLEPGNYSFISLTEDQQQKIYGVKIYKLETLSPEQAAKFDIVELSTAQESLKRLAAETATAFIDDRYIISEPIDIKVTSVSYLRKGDKLALRGHFDYTWVKVKENDIYSLILAKYKDKKLTFSELDQAVLELKPLNINSASQTMTVSSLWTIQ
ncbi:MAG: type IV pilus assembly protein PilM [Candidatus Komeilibacteria bacterium]